MRLLSLLIFLFASNSTPAQTWDTAWNLESADGKGLFGGSVDGGFDVNQDGFDDFLVGAPATVVNGVLYSGATFVRSGKDGSSIYELFGTDLPGTQFGGLFGDSVSWISDLNGDAIPDFIVGARNKATPAVGDGEVIVYSGADGTVIHNLVRSHSYIRGFGSQVAPAGDLDGDGVPDILVGAEDTYSGGTYTGAILVFSGASGAELLRINGNQVGEKFGSTLAFLGDVNSDGSPDYLVGAFAYDVGFSINVGQARLFSGATGTLLYEYTGMQQNDRLGVCVAGGSDLNGDAVPDFLIASNGIGSIGAVSAYSGLDGSIMFQLTGEVVSSYGQSICLLNDVDGDGVSEIVIGADGFDHNSNIFDAEGSVYLYSGATQFLMNRFDGELDGQRFGTAVASSGDVSLSGTSGIIVGSTGYSSTGVFDGGQVHVYFDSSSPSADDEDADALWYFREIGLGTDPLDQDTDDDGLSDGEEHFGTGPNAVAFTDPLLLDSDADGIQDGTELGVDSIVWTGNPPTIQGTDPLIFQPDLDALTTTDPNAVDSDGGGVPDGGEDLNSNGRIDLYETDPNNLADDRIPGLISSDWTTVSNSSAQVTALTLDFGMDYAGHNFRILGSLTGSAPGFAYQGVSIPLIFDSLTTVLASGGIPVMFVNFGGQLDAQGLALAYLATRPGEISAFVGQSVWFAAVSIDPVSGLLSNATVAVSLDLIP
ncbi:MAG: FG-GAP repeat protein [Planctomycetes bacterium]|nr:FG-GAP repeat protein [Planctomycetota bacterium]